MFGYNERRGSSFIFLYMSTHLLKRLFFSPLYVLVLLSKISWLYEHGLISDFTVLFHWSMCFQCQYHAVLITIALQYVSKLGFKSRPCFFQATFLAIDFIYLCSDLDFFLLLILRFSLFCLSLRYIFEIHFILNVCLYCHKLPSPYCFCYIPQVLVSCYHFQFINYQFFYFPF